MAVVNVTFPGNLAKVASAAELRAIPASYLADSAAYLVDALGIFDWNPSSLANDDGKSILKPDGFTSLQAGRWVYTGATGIDQAQLNAAVADFAAPTGAAKVGILQLGTGAVARTAEDKLRDTLSARDFGAKFDGATDDRAALQAAINAAHATGKTLILPNGDAKISGSLDLKGKGVSIVGPDTEACVITATTAMATMLDIAETADKPTLRLNLSGFTLSGGNLAAIGYDFRYRHNTTISDVRIINCAIGLREKDAWNNYRCNVRAINCATGFSLVGSNHSTLFSKCGANGATTAALMVDIQGTAADGNMGVAFQSCNFDFNPGKSVVVAGGTVTFDTCYIGENGGGVVVENRGFTTIRGGALFIGYAAGSSEVRPLGGSLLVERAAVNGQGAENLRSTGRLLSSEYVSAGVGPVAYLDCAGNINTNPIGLTGEPFGIVRGKSYAMRNGRTYQKNTFGGADATLSYDGDALIATVTSAGTSGAISIWTPLSDDWSRSGAVFFLPVYQSTMPVVAKISNGSLGAGYTLISLSANTTPETVPVVNSVPSAAPYNVLEFVITSPVAGGVFRLTRATFSDALFQNKRGAAFGTIGAPA